MPGELALQGVDAIAAREQFIFERRRSALACAAPASLPYAAPPGAGQLLAQLGVLGSGARDGDGAFGVGDARAFAEFLDASLGGGQRAAQFFDQRR